MRNEDLLVMPASWLAGLHPRRGGVAVPPPAGAKDAVKKFERLVSSKVGDLTASLARPETDPDLRAAVQGFLAGGTGAASPLGIAVVSAKLLRRIAGTRVDATVIADAWIAAHGPVFAAVAAAELVDLRVGASGANWQQKDEQIARRLPAESTNLDWMPVLGRVRAHLVAVPEAQQPEVREALAAVRAARGLHSRAAASFLLPECKDWVDEDIPAVGSSASRHTVTLVMCALGDAAQLSRFAPAQWRSELVRSDGALATVVDGVGAAIGPVLGELLGSLPPFRTEERERVAGALAVLPDDGAFRALIEHAAQPQAHLGLLDAAQRFPARAIRLLAGAAGPAGELFEAYAAGYPEALELARPHLDPATVPAPVVVDECDPGEVPAPLLADGPPPELPGWADAAVLPRVRLRTGETLPVDAARRLVALLTRARAGDGAGRSGRGRRGLRPCLARRVRLGVVPAVAGDRAADVRHVGDARAGLDRRRRRGPAPDPAHQGLARHGWAPPLGRRAVGADRAGHRRGAHPPQRRGGEGQVRRARLDRAEHAAHGRRAARPDRRAARRPARAGPRPGGRRWPGARLRAAPVRRRLRRPAAPDRRRRGTAGGSSRCRSRARATTPRWVRPHTSGSARSRRTCGPSPATRSAGSSGRW